MKEQYTEEEKLLLNKFIIDDLTTLLKRYNVDEESERIVKGLIQRVRNLGRYNDKLRASKTLE